MLQGDRNRTVAAIAVAKAWKDPKFKRRLMRDPCSVLREEGADIPIGASLEVFDGTGARGKEFETSAQLVIPPLPIGVDPESLAVAELLKIITKAADAEQTTEAVESETVATTETVSAETTEAVAAETTETAAAETTVVAVSEAVLT